MGSDARPVKAPQASQARPVLRTRTPLSLRDISPRSGESPHCVGRLIARALPARKPPHMWGGGRAKQGRKGSARCPLQKNFLLHFPEIHV